MRSWVGLLLSFSCGTSVSAAGLQQPLVVSSHGPVLTERLDDAISGILKNFKTPGGVGVAVVHKTSDGNWQLESKGYGNASSSGDKVTADTLFAIGSNSKLFDILATGLLISNETLTPRISWSSKIASILPAWKLMDPVATSESTIVDLMSHRTGLPRHDFMGPLYLSREDAISRLQYLRPSTGFREQLQYNNHMYTVLSHIPEVLLNTTYEKYVHDTIFTPLGMNSTTFFYSDAIKTGHLAGSFLRMDANQTEDPFNEGSIRELEFWDRSETGHVVSGAGGIISSARDMAVWLQTLLTEGKNQNNEAIIPSEVIRKVASGITVFTPQARYPELSAVVYGGGQMRATYRGAELIEHGGSTPGFKSQVTRFPSRDFGVAVMSNEENLGNPIMESVKYRIIDEFLKLEPIDWTERYHKKLAQAVPTPPIQRSENAEPPTVLYKTLAGAYENSAYGHLDFCLSWKNTTVGSACSTLDIGTLSNIIDPTVPTLISKWNTMISDHLRLSHYSGNTFNLTAVQTSPTGNETWVMVEGMRAEFESAHEGLGFAPIDVWGPGDDVPSPEGGSLRERAEVWFEKIP